MAIVFSVFWLLLAVVFKLACNDKEAFMVGIICSTIWAAANWVRYSK
jgi:hypothetical protein